MSQFRAVSTKYDDFSDMSYSSNIRPPRRVVSRLNRSKEILSLEGELITLLEGCNISLVKKQAIKGLIEKTFQLFRCPVNDETLIDSASVATYHKMQLLVQSLTSLIMDVEQGWEEMNVYMSGLDLNGGTRGGDIRDGDELSGEEFDEEENL